MDVKKTDLRMSLLMGASMSLILSRVGLLSAGRFTVGDFLKSFIISFPISLVLGLIIPGKKICDALIAKCNLVRESVSARMLEAFVMDLIYSPVMTFVMVYLAYRRAVSHGARIPFGPMLLKSELISFAVGFVLNYVMTPVFVRLVMRGNRR